MVLGAAAMVPFGSTAASILARFRQPERCYLLCALRLAKHGCFRCAPVLTGSGGELSVPTTLCEMQLCARTDVHSRKSRHVGDLSSKMGTLLSRIATYPPGALRRAGASGDRAIAIAGRDVPPRPPRRFHAEARDAPLRSRVFDDVTLSCGRFGLANLSACCSGFQCFQYFSTA